MLISMDDCSLSAEQLLAVADTMAGCIGLQSLISSVSRVVADFNRHDHLDIAVVSADRQRTVTIETGLSTDWSGGDWALDASPIRDLFRGNVPFILTADAQTDPRFREDGIYSAPIFNAGLHSRLHVPITVSGEVFGALSFSRSKRDPFSPRDVANMLAVCRIIGPYVHGLVQADRANAAETAVSRQSARFEGLRDGARRLAGDMEETRARIAMELHDQTLADLARISRNLSQSDQLQGVRLQSIRSDVDHCLIELRRIVDDAKPAVLELFGLPEAIRHQIEKEAIHHPIVEAHFTDDTNGVDRDLSEDVTFGFFRIAQEAIHNAFKHSCADTIDVRLYEANTMLVLEVEDDGIGINGAKLNGSSGIHNMRTRAALFGARLDITKPRGSDGLKVVLAIEH